MTEPASTLTLPSPAILGRPLRDIDVRDSLSALAGTTVLVTGAAGSVGSALVAVLAKSGVARIVAVDQHEASLFRLGRDVQAEGRLQLRLADVRNTKKIQRVLDEARPAIVFHLAAYKHVPFGQTEPDETISVNVLATAALLRISASAGVGSFVYPSSDKAVNPPSLYGATKRIAETVVLGGSNRAMRTHVARYVNIVGTSGSVVETFTRQILANRALTLTDPRMTRYWMDMAEATSILVHALTEDTGSCTLLDVGDPIPVREIALRIFRAIRGEETEPEIVVTGSRPGERLFEELISQSERVTRCDEDPVWRVVHSRRDDCSSRVGQMVDELAALVEAGAAAELTARTMAFASQLQ